MDSIPAWVTKKRRSILPSEAHSDESRTQVPGSQNDQEDDSQRHLDPESQDNHIDDRTNLLRNRISMENIAEIPDDTANSRDQDIPGSNDDSGPQQPKEDCITKSRTQVPGLCDAAEDGPLNTSSDETCTTRSGRKVRRPKNLQDYV